MQDTRRFSGLLRRLVLTYRLGFVLIAVVTVGSYFATAHFLGHLATAYASVADQDLIAEIALVRKAALVGTVTILLVLLIEAALVFRPTVRRLRREREVRERIAAVRDSALDAVRLSDARLAESERRFRSSFESAAIGMALVDFSGRFFEVNPSLCEMLGYEEAELTGLDKRHVTHPDDLAVSLDKLDRLAHGTIRSYSHEKRYVRKDGRIIWALLTMGAVRDSEDRPLYGVAQIEDVSARRKAEEDAARYAAELRALALTDELTGVHNRRGFRVVAERACRAQHRSPEPLMLAAVDLDHLKQINDQWGHAAGDRALQLVARALISTFRDSDIIGRMGGDEFLCLLPNAIAFEDRQVRERLDRTLARFVSEANEPFPVLATMGTAVAMPMTAVELDALIREADSALYSRKQHRGEASAVFGAADDQ